MRYILLVLILSGCATEPDFTDTGVGCIDCMEPMIEPASEPVIADTLPFLIKEGE